MARELTEVGVVGLGTMGAGIAEVMARAGLSVTAVEISEDALARGRAEERDEHALQVRPLCEGFLQGLG